MKPDADISAVTVKESWDLVLTGAPYPVEVDYYVDGVYQYTCTHMAQQGDVVVTLGGEAWDYLDVPS